MRREDEAQALLGGAADPARVVRRGGFEQVAVYKLRAFEEQAQVLLRVESALLCRLIVVRCG